MAYNDGGYKITINEKTSKEEILNTFAKILTYLETTHGIEEFAKINLYLQMYKDDERQMLVDTNNILSGETGRILKPEKPHKTFQQLTDGSKKVIFDKGLNGKRLEDTVSSFIQNPSIKTTSTMIPVSKMEAYRKKMKKREEELIKKREEERQDLHAKEQAKRDHEIAILNGFKTFIANKLGCNINELQLYTTSIAHLKDRKTILKYLDGKPIPSSEEAFRVTYKDLTTKKASFVEIYSMDLEFLNKFTQL